MEQKYLIDTEENKIVSEGDTRKSAELWTSFPGTGRDLLLSWR